MLTIACCNNNINPLQTFNVVKTVLIRKKALTMNGCDLLTMRYSQEISERRLARVVEGQKSESSLQLLQHLFRNKIIKLKKTTFFISTHLVVWIIFKINLQSVIRHPDKSTFVNRQEKQLSIHNQSSCQINICKQVRKVGSQPSFTNQSSCQINIRRPLTSVKSTVVTARITCICIVSGRELH